MIGIIGAMDIELTYFFKNMVISKTELIADKTFYLGKIAGKEVVIGKSDIGKVNATITATIIANYFKADLIINTGIAGGIKPVQQGDIIIAKGLAYFDASISGIDDLPHGKLGDDPLIVPVQTSLVEQAEAIFKKLNYDYKIGHIVTGDKFVTKLKTLDKISRNVDNILACEMEGMAVAMTAYKFNIPFVSIRAISDIIEDNNQKASYQLVSKQVAEKSSSFVLAFINECKI